MDVKQISYLGRRVQRMNFEDKLSNLETSGRFVINISSLPEKRISDNGQLLFYTVEATITGFQDGEEKQESFQANAIIETVFGLQESFSNDGADLREIDWYFMSHTKAVVKEVMENLLQPTYYHSISIPLSKGATN